MKCPYCNHEDTKVTDSREADDGIRRRRECLGCGRRFTTYERVQANLYVVKKDGRREEYSREKLRVGITRSCAKLPVTGPQIEALLDDIEVALHAMGGMELPSTEVGDLVMERLRELNYAAYVRFAAHAARSAARAYAHRRRPPPDAALSGGTNGVQHRPRMPL